MRGWGVYAAAIALALLCVVLCGARTANLRALDELAHEPPPVLRTFDPPVAVYPGTREAAVHGTPVTLRFGDEAYEIDPTAEELAYGMRWSREP